MTINASKDWIYDLYVKEIICQTTKPIPKEQHVGRGSCCGNGCLHCPYYPKYEKGSTTLQK
jgi:hypothetical protein